MQKLIEWFYGGVRLYWRITQPRTLGVVAVLLVGDDEVLLVKHRYRRGWSLPGGGVKRGESIFEALARELEEELKVRAVVEPGKLHGIFYNRTDFKHDHCAVVVVDNWQRAPGNPLSIELSEAAVFPLRDLPEDVAPGTRARLRALLEAPSSLATTDRWLSKTDDR